MTRLLTLSAGFLLACGLAATSPSTLAGPLTDAVTGGRTQLALRLRYEYVDQQNPLDVARALTLRTALGYTTGSWQNLQLFAELEHVADLVDDYSPTPPPQRYSVVPDPAGTEMNLWGIRYSGMPGLTATAGRARLALDNARWIGNVGWRQNEQTYDGAFLQYQPNAQFNLQAAQFHNVNSIFATNMDVETTVLNGRWSPTASLALTAYGYRLRPGPGDLHSDTYGLRVVGSAALIHALRIAYVLEAARQDARTAGGNFDAPYHLGEITVTGAPIQVAAGQETLGSDAGQYAVQTPLATLHAHNGWVDIFLTTPATGLRDRYLRATGKLGPVSWMVVHHWFDADQGNARYGRELDAQLTMPLANGASAGLKYGRYTAETLAVDSDKAWVWLAYGF